MFVAAKLYDRFGTSIVVGELNEATLERALSNMSDDEADEFLEESAGAKVWLNEFVGAVVGGFAELNNNGTIDYFGDDFVAFGAATEEAAKAGLIELMIDMEGS